MSYLSKLKTEASYTRTLNGAKAHSASGDACLDLFALAGGMRGRRRQELNTMFDRAYIENPELAMKLLFHIRDVRGGIGEREIFRGLVRHAALRTPDSVRKNVRWIAEYGRWDDLMCLMGTPVQGEIVRVIREQLDRDIEAVNRRNAGETDAPVSLLGKWLPSVNTSSARTRGQARVLINALGMDDKAYRKTLKMLRAHSCVTERYLTSGKTEKIRFEAVPAKAMLNYRNAFARHCPERFGEYTEKAARGEAAIHSATLFPYEILRPFFNGDCWITERPERHADGEQVLDALWNSLPAEIGSQNAIAVVDTSGSMYCGRPGNPTPALISQALGIYFAERCRGAFHNHFITFESNPHLLEIKGETLSDKLSYLSNAPWGMSTNLEAVFELILKIAVYHNAAQDEMPSVLYIISDMEFNQAVENPERTVYENAKKLFEAYGYHIPAIVFQNVNSWQQQLPVTAHTKGTAMVSGAGTAAMSHAFDGNITPLDHMLRVLNSARYERIHA